MEAVLVLPHLETATDPALRVAKTLDRVVGGVKMDVGGVRVGGDQQTKQRGQSKMLWSG